MQQTVVRPAAHRHHPSFPATSAPAHLSSRPASQGPSYDLRRRVVASLSSVGYAALSRIDCEVDYGRIILAGSVSSYHLKQMAQVAALRVAGVHRVENRVVVATP